MQNECCARIERGENVINYQLSFVMATIELLERDREGERKYKQLFSISCNLWFTID